MANHPRQAQVEAFLAGATRIIAGYYTKNYPNLPVPVPTVTFGKRYAKVLLEGAAWAFLDLASGDVLKPASWSTPAKHARGSLDDATGGLGRVGPFGPEYLK
jgi:hypothetical protein